MNREGENVDILSDEERLQQQQQHQKNFSSKKTLQNLNKKISLNSINAIKVVCSLISAQISLKQ